MSDAPAPVAFRARCAALGLVDAEDIAALERGWTGLQPQLARLRRGLEDPAAGEDRSR